MLMTRLHQQIYKTRRNDEVFEEMEEKHADAMTASTDIYKEKVVEDNDEVFEEMEQADDMLHLQIIPRR